MKKELLKLQARNREINDRLTAMYVKAENEKREFNEEENREERELKRELEQNHREIMNSRTSQPSCVSSSRLSRRSARTLPPS